MRSTSWGWPGPTAILFDLGVSSMQLDLADRGFSYAQDAAAGHAHGPERRDARPPTSSTRPRPAS